MAVYTDMKRAKKFYIEILGFETFSEATPQLCLLKSTSSDINIYLAGGYKPASTDNKISRLSFFLSASETYALLKTAGVKLLQEAPGFVGDNTYCFQFEDPDGNIIEVAGST